MLMEKLKAEFTSGKLNGKTKKQIFILLGVKKSAEKDQIANALENLCKELFLGFNDGKYFLFEDSGLKVGKLKCHEGGYAFFIPETPNSADMFIPARHKNGGLQGDRVVVGKVASKKASSDEGEVLFILERGVKYLIGTLYTEKSFAFVVPDDRGFGSDIYIPRGNYRGAKTGDKVYCEIEKYFTDKNPQGRIISVLSEKKELEAGEKVVIDNSHIPTEFSEEVLAEADSISLTVSELDKVGRLDLTGEFIITIDGDDSRDFDDAISLVKHDNGYTLGVHIADVSHYVKQGGKIDQCAYERGTSVYFPDRVYPMLPERLSNGICSLAEGVERLAFSCIMEVDFSGDVKDYKFARSVIKSRHRMTYKKVQAILDGDNGLRSEYSDIVSMLEDCSSLADVLYEKRKKAGSVNIESRESEIYVKEGKVFVEKAANMQSNQLIEEFMLLANKTVAEHCFYLGIPFVYRIHEKPKEEKISLFTAFLKALGVRTKWNEKNYYSTDFTALLDKIKGEAYFGVVNDMMLRSMQKAKYSPEEIGHFGLGFEHYCHFTSPIRRYPDLTVHRILAQALTDYSSCQEYADKVGEISEHSSVCERRADELERTVDDIFKAYYLKQFIGEDFEGIISGVTNFGIFVELENSCEGLVGIADLPAGFYRFDQGSYTLFSDKHSYTLGQKIKITVAGCDVTNGKIEFVLAK